MISTYHMPSRGKSGLAMMMPSALVTRWELAPLLLQHSFPLASMTPLCVQCVCVCVCVCVCACAYKTARGMGRGGRWEGGSGWGTHVHPWWIHVNVWQNQYNIVK